jgi:hypothetical protein
MIPKGKTTENGRGPIPHNRDKPLSAPEKAPGTFSGGLKKPDISKPPKINVF